MATLEETLRSLGLSAVRGIPQLATGFVDLAALPFTATGMLKPEEAVGSTAYLTSKGLLPPEQQGLLNQTTELLSGAINPAVATKAALAKGGLLMAAPIAYHGSPYMFDKFDISKLGTGEGSQAYGHGMYFAENMPTARQFAAISSNPGFRQGTGTGTDLATLDAIIKLNARNFTDGDVNKLADIIKRKPGAFSKPDQMLERISSYVNDNPPSYLYKVDVPDAAAKTFLNWDQPISSQKQGTKALQQINKKYDFGYDKSFTGGDFYKALTTDFIRTGKATNQKEAQKLVSDELNKIGIKGIKHLDPNAKTEGLSNYVVFDPSMVKILERNNKPMQGLLK
jgi:hypothetical protein